MATAQYTSKNVANFWSHVAITADDNQCWLWLACKNELGYGKLTIRGKTIKAHRFSWMLPNYAIPDGMLILHSCDNPSCVNPKHLFLGTQKENIQDMIAKKRSNFHITVLNCGENHLRHKLTEAQVKEIRSRFASGEATKKELSVEFGVCETNIRSIVTKRNWNHVK